MIIKPKALIMLIWNSIILVPMVPMYLQEIVIFSFFLFLKIVKVLFKMKLQSFFSSEFFQGPANHDFLYLSPTYQNGINRSFPCS